MAKKRILLLHSCFLIPGGAERQLLWLAGELCARGHRLSILATAFGPWAREFLKKAEIAYHQLDLRDPALALSGLKLNLSGGLPLIKSVPRRTLLQSPKKRILQKMGEQILSFSGSFDLVLTGNFPSYLWYYLARQKADLPALNWFCFEPPPSLYRHLVFTHFHKANPKPPRDLVELEEEAVRSARKILTTTNFIKQKGAEIYRREDFIPVYGGLPELPVVEADSLFDFPYIFSVSRLTPEKNYSTLIRAFSRVKTETKLVIAGEGEEREKLEALAARLGQKERMIFAGRVGEEELHNLYRHSRLVVFLPIDEPMGLVPMEAGFRKKAVLASSHGGPAEVVKAGETGLLADPQKEEEIKERLEQLLSEPKMLEEMGERAFSLCRERFSLKAFADRVVQALGI